MEKTKEAAQKTAPVDKPVFWIGFLVVAFVCALLAIFSEPAKDVLGKIFNFTTNQLGFTYIWFTLIVAGILAWLAFGKYGKVRMGGPDAKPEFTRMSWIAMFFCSGIGTSLLYWAAIEWVYYYQGPPFGLEPGSVAAADWASMYGIYHWGILGWVIYCLPAIPIGYAFHNRKFKALRLSNACAGVLGEKVVKGPVGKIIDLLFIFGLIGGTGTSLGLGTPMLAEAISKLIGIPHTFGVDIVIVVIWTAIFTTSAALGLRKGIKRLSDINVWVAFTLCGLILIVGPTRFIIETFTNGLGLMFNNFIKMSFYMDPIGKSSFPQWWTIFYWAWWVAYGPYMGLFITKVSRGRTFREIIVAVCTAGPLGCALFFAIFGNNALHQELNGIFPVVQTMNEVGAPAAIVGSITALPLAFLILILFCILGFVYSATTVDSSAYTIAAVVSKDLRPDQEPRAWNRIFWALALGGIALALMNIGGLKALQTSSLIVALPLMIVMIITVFSLFKWLKQDKAEKTQVAKEDL
jgi:BCCT family betaine/carnitine transporter